MATKVLQSGLKLSGIAPNILLSHVENTVPFLFGGEIKPNGKDQEYLAKLIHYKKNLKQLHHIDLAEYFYLCLAAHWATAGTFVPTDVDNQIREGLWLHPQAKRFMKKMAQKTIDSWGWDYTLVTNRKSYNNETGHVLSTHEGTWLSVAIGAYCALDTNSLMDEATMVKEAILGEIKKEEELLIQLRKNKDHINFLRTCALMAHNFGDLDRVMDQWGMDTESDFYQDIYKLGHKLNKNYSPILVYAGQVNKEFLAQENHRHMSMRQPKCLRRSKDFLIPVGPFMDDWGKFLGLTKKLSLDEKGEVVGAFFEGYKRQDRAYGYVRAFAGMMANLPQGLKTLEREIPFDMLEEMKKSGFIEKSHQTKADFEKMYKEKLEAFVCPLTGMKF